MKKIITICTVFLSIATFSQQKIVAGKPFQFTVKTEKDVKFTMVDENNVYLQSTVLNDFPAFRKFFVRKLDGNNNLLQEFTTNYPSVDDRGLFNYVGSFSNAKKVAFFNESYSGKAKKAEVYKTVFDKESEKFTTTTIFSYPIESLNKSGDFDFSVSDNGRYAGIINYSYAGRKDPKKITVKLFDTNSTEEIWTKEFTIADETVIRYFAISNTGKAFITRDPSSYKGSTKIIIVSKDNQDEKILDDGMLMHQPYLFSKGTEDFLFAFNSTSRNTEKTFEKLLIYDVEQGKILSNTVIPEYTNKKKPEEIIIRNVFFQNNQFQVFTEGKLSAGTAKKPSPMGTMTFDEPIFKYGSSLALAFDEMGALKNKKNIGSSSFAADVDNYRAFGLLNVMGNYKIVSDSTYSLSEVSPNDFKSESEYVDTQNAEVIGNPKNEIILNKVVYYDPKNKNYYFLQIKDNEANVIDVSGYKKTDKRK